MVVITALRDAVSLLRRHPILFVPTAVFAVLQVPQLFLNTLGPLVSIAGSLLFTAVLAFVAPAFYAGTIGMTDDAASGDRTSLGRFWTHAKEHYVSMLGAYLLLLGVSLVFGFVLSFGGFFLIAAVIGMQAGLGVTAALGVVAAIVVLAYLIGLFAVHFYGHAIVIEDYGVTDGLTRSVDVVRDNVTSMLGYGVLSIVFGGVVGAIYGGLIVLLFPTPEAPGQPMPTPDLLPALLGSVGVVVTMTVFTTVFLAYSVTFYRALIDADGTAPDTDATEPNVDTRPGDDAELAG
ncbi:hypothetical protein B4589_015350 (plasmid) [Halolamina sp. CBA1230]|uniref:DUF7847 domain-containing protein n=1 Tax=Halolamina sp. CBA1230 TaxID=1853690 RepID=UPI0009A224C3|nr:hypothetical protein [Halolamina sp. CBA1230]QKY21799.1 hypothetical protein B4589_015350 [Halolamina sp. CBA1230]